MSEPPTLWHAVTPHAKTYPGATSDVATDVVVVGGGFAGLSVALELARSGTDVTLIEARRIASGASGRNAGFVVPNFSRADPATVIARLGAERGGKLLNLVGRGADTVFDHAAEFSLGPHADRSGWLQPAHSAQMAAALQQRAVDWQALGRPVTWIGPEETVARTGVQIYHGALADASGGVINPVAYARAMAETAVSNGAVIHEETAAADIVPDGAGWRVVTRKGVSLRARRVLLATNAETLGAAGQLARLVVPLRVYQIATAPLPAERIAVFSPRREAVSDTRANIFTYRLDADNRLISGGMAILPFGAEARMARRISQRLALELSLPDIPPVEHIWTGTAAVTRDFLPHLYSLGDGFHAVTACNGRGVAMTTMLGAALAPMLRGEVAPDQTAVPLAPARTIPFRAFARAAPSAFLVQGMLRDRAEIRQSNGSHSAARQHVEYER
ncbi:MAG: FAD-binding oxidoreductase [Alphaproteobacteria bacterium]|nr:FAD-binding oxidoreductase [Alphaproteobacteria bacterium]